MSSGITHMNGLMAGAARPATCAVHAGIAGTPAPIHSVKHEQKWLGAMYQAASPVFTTDRPNPRPLERSP